MSFIKGLSNTFFMTAYVYVVTKAFLMRFWYIPVTILVCIAIGYFIGIQRVSSGS